jgi:hypothetical protein
MCGVWRRHATPPRAALSECRWVTTSVRVWVGDALHESGKPRSSSPRCALSSAKSAAQSLALADVAAGVEDAATWLAPSAGRAAQPLAERQAQRRTARAATFALGARCADERAAVESDATLARRKKGTPGVLSARPAAAAPVAPARRPTSKSAARPQVAGNVLAGRGAKRRDCAAVSAPAAAGDDAGRQRGSTAPADAPRLNSA